jgi:hypothetical protein
MAAQRQSNINVIYFVIHATGIKAQNIQIVFIVLKGYYIP